MKWNWELPNWPNFGFDSKKIATQEKQFLLRAGESGAFLTNINSEDKKQFIVEILSMEGAESSKIEGEILNRESLQSSIKQHFGLKDSKKKGPSKELGMAKLLCDVYETFSAPLTHEMLHRWHSMLFHDPTENIECGTYRSHKEPMQIVSNRYDLQKIFFEAPPSSQIYFEMTKFIDWFNSTELSDSVLTKASVAHVYFESIHPFEDGNGRIGRALVEKLLSQNIGKPLLLAISKTLEEKKQKYYAALGKCNQTLEIQPWVDFFSDCVLKAQQESIHMIVFLIEKSKLLLKLKNQLNTRQEKVLLRMFKEGLDGFTGGLSAENYIKITKTSRASATRDLSELVQMGALIKTGQFRYSRYWLNVKNNWHKK